MLCPICKTRPLKISTNKRLKTCGEAECIRKLSGRHSHMAAKKKHFFTCPNCKTKHAGRLLHSNQKDSFCDAKCKEEYTAGLVKSEKIDAVKYLLKLSEVITLSSPVKILSKEEIEAIKPEITPIEQIPRYGKYAKTWG